MRFKDVRFVMLGHTAYRWKSGYKPMSVWFQNSLTINLYCLLSAFNSSLSLFPQPVSHQLLFILPWKDLISVSYLSTTTSLGHALIIICLSAEIAFWLLSLGRGISFCALQGNCFYFTISNLPGFVGWMKLRTHGLRFGVLHDFTFTDLTLKK